MSTGKSDIELANRILLKKQGKTKIYALCTNRPWFLPFDGLVIPVGYQGGIGGFGQSFLADLGQTDYGASFFDFMQKELSKNNLSEIQPDQPLLLSLPPEINLTLSQLQGNEAERFTILATVESDSKTGIIINASNAAKAAAAAIRLAATQRLTRLVIPPLGSGVNRLNKQEVAIAMLQAIDRALATNQNKNHVIEEVTIVDRENLTGILRTAALRLNDFLAQSPKNDLPSGQDLLNIENEVHALAEVLLMRSLEPPLAVGILGGWGSGKSHIMHLMQQKMTQIRSQPVNEKKAWGNLANCDRDSVKEQLSPYVGHVYQITFDAWTYARSNLWASLMETILFELNRQLTLENQLEKLGVFAYEGGKIWEALNEMSDLQRRELFYDAKLTKEQLEKLEKSGTHSEVEDLLWESLETSKKREVQALKDKEKELQAEQKKLDEKIRQVQQEVEEKIVNKPEKEIWFQQIKDELLEKYLGKEFKEFKDKIKQTIQDNQQDSESLDNKFADFKANKIVTLKSLTYWISKNRKLIILFIIILIISFAILFKLEQLKAGIIPQISAALVTITPGIAVAQELVKKWRGYIETISKKFDDYQKKVEKLAETERLNSAKIREEEVKKRLDTPEVKASEEKIKYLQADVEQQRQIVIQISQVSLPDFISNQLENGLYGKRLGLMQQVKNDLATITEQLLPPKQKSERFKEHIERLQGIFPRGPARVVLYIDDLDRCPPNRVVEVLEAVQLLVKTPLFVVVLAIDERYIARALEKVYAGVLHRNGKPSGIDYIEKIIQIPYRVRPIARSSLKNYLEAQMQYDKGEVEDINDKKLTPDIDESQPERNEGTRQIVARGTVNNTADDSKAESDDKTELMEDLPLQVIEFTKEEFDTVHECCQHIDLSPRTLKRLINVYKLFKIIWFRSSRLEDIQEDETIRKVIVSFLALSGRYPCLMRSVFEDLEMYFEESRDLERNLLEFFPQKPSVNSDGYLYREWKRLSHDVKMLGLNDITLQQLGEDTFNMVRAFCFVGDIGYDPDDFIHHQQLSSTGSD
ncbi:MAG: P-loop NTPase fold protein [Aulosira sp. ZfuVER01]|nr:P-loop NTPase fold protein [Aulosira sp. ZfuVER01]MDZ8001736.1 P-loop NTPase fold protein [Aulosira sp. DedVER01a]MDZ8054714.1 P-loop NTPase fold protein [Aulosira sp. ZfuCHP01]